MLDRAVRLGFYDLWLLDADPNLASFRASKEFAEIRASVRARLQSNLRRSDPELYRLYAADQSDRIPGPGGIDWARVAPRDARRRARVRELVARRRAKTALDWFHAAMVLQHGLDEQDIALAHEWALRAVELNPANNDARWLGAAAKDRLLMYRKERQWYGTQFVRRDGQWVLYEVDPSISDHERARWNVRPIAAARDKARQLNEQ